MWVSRRSTPRSAGAGDYRLWEDVERRAAFRRRNRRRTRALFPLFLIVGYLVGVVLLVAAATGRWEPMTMMRHFMAGFFLVFSFFKLLDPPGFVSVPRLRPPRPPLERLGVRLPLHRARPRRRVPR